MPVNLKGRNFLKELDFTPEEFKFLLWLSKELKAAKIRGLRTAAHDGQEHRADLREDLDAHALRLRGGRVTIRARTSPIWGRKARRSARRNR